MKSASNIVSAIHHIKQAFDHYEDFVRSNPGTKGAMLFNQYKKRLEWIYNDMITHPLLTPVVRTGIKQEWNSDAFSVDAISEKAALLNPQQREVLENLIEQMMKGELIEIEKINKIKCQTDF